METNQKPIIGIVSPCYNEELVLNETLVQLNEIIKDLIAQNIISEKSFSVFVDDGSKDRTWNIISPPFLEKLWEDFYT